MKKLIVFLMLIVVPVVFADYNYYDDFSTLNTDIWNDENGVFSIVDGQLQCNPDHITLRGMEFLPDVDFSKEWIVEYSLTWQDDYAVTTPWIMNKFSDAYASDRTWYGINVYRNASNNDAELYIEEWWNGAGIHTSGPRIPATGIFKFVKDNNKDGTFTVKVYYNGEYHSSLTSTKNWQLPDVREVDNLFLACNLNSNNDWRMDWIKITVNERNSKPGHGHSGGGYKPPSGVPEFNFGTMAAAIVLTTIGLFTIRNRI